MKNCPPPGIYYNIPFDEAELNICAEANPKVLEIGSYLSWDAISNSRLSLAKKSMAHYHENRPVEETPFMRRGTLIHTLFFEPTMFAARFAVMSIKASELRRPNGNQYDSPRLSSAWKEAVQECQELNPGLRIIEREDYSQALRIVDAIRDNDLADEYFEHGSKFEVAIVWDDPATGLRCKGRMDAWRSTAGQIGDLKTSKDISNFPSNIARFGYHRQAAFYIDGMKILTGETNDFTLTAVEVGSPICVLAAPMSDEAIEVGRDEYKTFLKQIAESKKSEVYPGYENPGEWRLPSWATPKDEPFELVIGGNTVSM